MRRWFWAITSAGERGIAGLTQSFESEALSRLQAGNVEEMRGLTRVVRSDGRYSLWSTPYGEIWMPTASRDALIYDLAEQRRNIYGSRIKAGDVVLDAGANVGVFTRKALWSGASKVVAIEPSPENVECLKRNFAREIADGRVIVYAKGVWDKDDVLKMARGPGRLGEEHVRGQHQGRGVRGAAADHDRQDGGRN